MQKLGGSQMKKNPPFLAIIVPFLSLPNASLFSKIWSERFENKFNETDFL